MEMNRTVAWVVAGILMAPCYVIGLESAFAQPSGGSRPVVISGVVRRLLLDGWTLGSNSGQVSNPQTRQALKWSGDKWVDTKTGQAVSGWQFDTSDPTRAFNPDTGQNAAWDEGKAQWIDVKTGQAVSASAVVKKQPSPTSQPPKAPPSKSVPKDEAEH